MSKFVFPVKGSYRITAPFGPRVHPITGKKSMHNGTDIIMQPVKTGAPIYAAEGGTVLEAKKSLAIGGGYGYYVKLKGDSGTEHIYAHMIAKSLKVSKGQKIIVGTHIGDMGTTGASTGVHLHWETRVGGKFYDPMKWWAEMTTPKPSGGTTRAADGTTYRARVSNAPKNSKVVVLQNGKSVFTKTVTTEADMKLVEKSGIPLAIGTNRIVITLNGQVLKETTYSRK
jgi:hypothetical protein